MTEFAPVYLVLAFLGATDALGDPSADVTSVVNIPMADTATCEVAKDSIAAAYFEFAGRMVAAASRTFAHCVTTGFEQTSKPKNSN